MFTSPVIVDDPLTMTVPLYGAVNLMCKAEGNPQPEIAWYKDDQKLNGVSSPVLNIQRVLVSDRGIYYCTANNSLGTATSKSATINIGSRST